MDYLLWRNTDGARPRRRRPSIREPCALGCFGRFVGPLCGRHHYCTYLFHHPTAVHRNHRFQITV